MNTFEFVGKTLLLAGVLGMSLGCSLYHARKAYDEQRYEDAVRSYRALLQKDPTNIQARIGLQRAAARAAEQHLEKAREAEKRGQDELVYEEVRKSVVLDPSNHAACGWLARLEEAAERRRALKEAEESVEVQRMRAESRNPVQLNPRSMEGTDLNFSSRQRLAEIFKILSRASGINIILHSSIQQDQQTSVDLRGLTFQRILDTLMLQNDMQYRVIDPNTIMIYKDQQQFRDRFENQVIKTFYLSNAEVDDVATTLRTLVSTLKVYVNKRLNAIVVKGKPADLVTARRVVNQLDKAKPEVMVYLELLEVTEDTLNQVGLLPVLSPVDQVGMFRMGAQLDASGPGGSNTNKGGMRISRSDIRFLFPSLALDAMKSNGDARLVASPNVRVVSGESGEVNIGQKISTTQSAISLPTTGTGTSGTGTNLSGYAGLGQTSYSYEDVGVKIKVKPRVHHDTDVTLEIDTKVTTLVGSAESGRPNLGQREIKTVTRLRDGETAVFGGLLKEDEQKNFQSIWGLGDIPVLGKLLGNTRNQKKKTDVILTVRAVLVRGPELHEEDFATYDPDQAVSQEGPFSGKPAEKKDAKPEAAKPEAAKPEAAKPEAAKPAAAPSAKPEAAKPAAAASAQPANTQPLTPLPTPPQPATSEAKPVPDRPLGPPPAPKPGATSLVLALSPMSTSLAQGERAQILLMVSEGAGLSQGDFELKVDPRLRLHTVMPGDFLTQEAGTLEQTTGKDGRTRVVFRRGTASGDSGILAILEVEALQKGNAPILVESGHFLVGTNPISARISNGLVTVD